MVSFQADKRWSQAWSGMGPLPDEALEAEAMAELENIRRNLWRKSKQDRPSRFASERSFTKAQSAKSRHAMSENADLASPVELACIWLEKARKGSVQWGECDVHQIRIWQLRRRLKPLKHIAFVIYLGVAFIEEPGWCVTNRDMCPRSSNGWLELVDMPQNQMFVVPFLWHGLLKTISLAFITFRIVLLRMSRGSTFQWTKWRIFQISLLAAAFADALFTLINEVGLIPGNIRLQRLLRPLVFMTSYKSLRETVSHVLAALPSFWELIVCLAVTIVGFSWIGLVLFQGTPEGEAHFSDLGSAVADMYILFTTANSPDAFIEAYHHHRYNVFFFIVYLIVSLYLFQSLIVAAVYDGYKHHLKAGLRQFYANRRVAVEKAFEMLAEPNEDNEPVILKDTWFGFFLCYCHHHRGNVRKICSDLFGKNRPDASGLHQAMLIYETLEEDDSEGLSLQKFRVLAEMLHANHFHVARSSPNTDRTTLSPELAQFWNRVQDFILTGVNVLGRVNLTWDNVVDILIFVDFFITVYATLLCIYARNGQLWAGKGLWNHAALCLTLVYFLGLNLKLYVLGFETYVSYNPFSVYDFINIYVLFFTEIYFWTYEETHASIRLYMVAHMGRYIRLLSYFGPFKDMALFMKKLRPTYQKLGMLLIVTFFIFAEIGQQSFGGLLHKGNELVKKTDYAQNGYWDFHFNDFPSSLVTLFVLLVVNNWFMIAEVYWILTGSWLTIAYFILFYLVTNLIVLNILMAFIIEVFQTLGGELLETDQEVHKQREELLRRESVLLHVMMGEEGKRMQYSRATKAARDIVDSRIKVLDGQQPRLKKALNRLRAANVVQGGNGNLQSAMQSAASRPAASHPAASQPIASQPPAIEMQLLPLHKF